MEKELAVANNKAEEVLVTVTERARESESVKKSVMQKKEAAETIVKTIEVDKGVAETALEAARPALEEAEVRTIVNSLYSIGHTTNMLIFIINFTVLSTGSVKHNQAGEHCDGEEVGEAAAPDHEGDGRHHDPLPHQAPSHQHGPHRALPQAELDGGVEGDGERNLPLSAAPLPQGLDQ